MTAISNHCFMPAIFTSSFAVKCCFSPSAKFASVQSKMVFTSRGKPREAPLGLRSNDSFGDGDVAQLEERRTGTSLTQVRSPGAERDLIFS